MSPYEKLDEAVIANIAAGRNNFTKIWSGVVYQEGARLSLLTGSEPFRIVDRRLQALRKAGKIAYSSKTGWAVVSA
ncbi:hypothetical protein [Polaromonas sp. YR568]|uniref:hypothetical protein n=1 Tax=Polaromonas sp. YR568 TaxID=1855301 RepID=UPI003137C235